MQSESENHVMMLRDMAALPNPVVPSFVKGEWHPCDPGNPEVGMCTDRGDFMSLAAYRDLEQQARQAVAPGRQSEQPVNRKHRRAREAKLARKQKAQFRAEATNQAALSMLMMVLAEHDGPVVVSAENVKKARTVPMFLKCTPQPDGGLIIALQDSE
jgi:hypothetical protein